MTDALQLQLQAALGSAYTIDRELGGGGMSRVFVARDIALGRDVVVKVLAPDLSEGLSAERFAREIRLAAALQDPHIVPLLSAGTTSEGLPYYTMPFVRGASLRERLNTRTIPAPEATRILRDIAVALQYAHEQGVVHRDIKPANVLLAGGSAVVTDFGIAKALLVSRTNAHTTLTQRGTSLGTPAYMAPEQAVGDEADARADIYAWGVIAYELLAGAHPFASRTTAQQLIAAHIAETPASLTNAPAGIPPTLAQLVMRALEKEPGKRPQTAGELVDAIDAFGVSASGSPSSAPERSQWASRATTRVAGIAAVAVAAVAGVWWFASRGEATTNTEVIAVAPFRVSGADPSLGYLREGLVDLLATKLATGTMARAVDPRTLLAAWRKAGAEERDLDPVKAVETARDVGAGQLLVGSVVGDQRRITINAVLVNSGNGDTVTSAEEIGPADSLTALVDRLAAKLLTLRSTEATYRLASATSTSLSALRPYLEGRALFRRARFTEAVSQFNVSLDADSTFALAGLALAEASVWTSMDTTSQARARRSIAQFGSRLTTRDSLLVEIIRGMNTELPEPPRVRAALLQLEKSPPTVLMPHISWGI